MHDQKYSRSRGAALLVASGTAVFVLLGAAHAQQTAEQYIPIGQSPGVSGELSLIGELVTVYEGNRELTVATDAGRRTIDVADSTRIWLDRSQLGRPNTQASFADCEVGRVVEIMPRRDDPSVAFWIKIRAE